VHSGAPSIDEIKAAILIHADIVGLDRFLSFGEFRNKAAHFLRPQHVADIDGAETPEVFVEFVPADEEPTLGVGEAAQGPTAGAIGNALKRALGTRITGLPFSRERIMAALLQ